MEKAKKMNVILGRDIKFFNLKTVYWGKSQWYKFRWFNDHIDLGIISIYELPQSGIGYLFWRLISIIIKPLRKWYHWKYVYSRKGQINNMLNEPYINEEKNDW